MDMMNKSKMKCCVLIWNLLLVLLVFRIKPGQESSHLVGATYASGTLRLAF
jgi:hypothetical protein